MSSLPVNISFIYVEDVIAISTRWQRSALFLSNVTAMETSAAPFDEVLHVFVINTEVVGQ